jgi:hypothetical protein
LRLRSAAWLNIPELTNSKTKLGGFMKKELALFTLALGLAATAPAFAGEEKITPKKQPVKMTETQMDKVTAGARQEGLVNVAVEDTEVVKGVQATLQASVAVLGTAANVGGNRGIVQ